MLCMEVEVQDVEEALPAQYEVEPIEPGFRIYDESNNGAEIMFGEDDGTPRAVVDNWGGATETLYEGQEQSTDGILSYDMFEEILEDEYLDEISRARGILGTGLETASEADSVDETVEALVESAEDAYGALEEEGKEATDFSFQCEPEKEPGNAYISIGNQGVQLGPEKASINMNDYDLEFSTPAAYIMGVVMLDGRNKKPNVSTGLSYKPGSVHHEEQEEQADMGLVQRATEITDYDFLN